MEKEETSGFLEKASIFLLLAGAFLLPNFFIPGGAISVDFGKTSFLVIFVALSFILWLAGNIRRGEISIPSNPIIISIFAILAFSVASALVSPSVKTSFWGAGFEGGTALVIISLCVLAFLFSSLFKDRERIILFYSLLAVSSLSVFIFQLFNIFVTPESALFGLFGGKTANLLGKWNDLSVLAGLEAVLSLLIIEFFALKKIFRVGVYLIFFLSVLFLAVTNFYLSWVLFGLFALFIFVYSFSFDNAFLPGPERFQAGRRISWPALFALVISIIFLLPQSFLGNFLAKNLGIYSVEVRPSWEATTDIALATMKENLLLGAGPNRFQNQWLMFKPEVVNNTPFWNTAFDSGSGIVPSAAVTTGLLGILSWAALLIFLLYYGLKTILRPLKDKLSNFLGLISFSGAAYFLASAVFYSPGVVNLGLGFAMVGIFVATLANNTHSGELKIFFSKSPWISFISVLISLILVVASIYAIYGVSARSAAAYRLGQIILPLNTPEAINNAETNAIKAIGLYESDYFYRALSDINLAKISFVGRNAKNLSESDAASLQLVLKIAIETAQKAVSFDSTKAENWISLSRIYADLVPLKVPGAYESAVASYNKALSLSPKDPSIYFALGATEAAKGDLAASKSYFIRSLELKNNYTDAAIAIARLSAEEGKTDEAISFLSKYASSNQNDSVVFYQIGAMEYSTADYQSAILALERAIFLNPVYADAKFFLGLSYNKLGRIQEAISQFEDVASLNPNNQEVKNIINSLKNPPQAEETVNKAKKKP